MDNLDDYVIRRFTDLAALTDEQLSHLARAREVAFQDALGEIERRRSAYSIPAWDEKSVAAALSLLRQGCPVSRTARTDDLPPALFRMGYEWCALSLIEVLDGILSHPSDDATMTTTFEFVGKGLYRQHGAPVLSDPRRRAALDIIKLLESFSATRQRGMFFIVPPRRHPYHPNDDQEALQSRICGAGKLDRSSSFIGRDNG